MDSPMTTIATIVKPSTPAAKARTAAAVRTELARLADTARTHLMVSHQLIAQLADPDRSVDKDCIRAVVLTTQQMETLLEGAPSLLPTLAPGSALSLRDA